MIGECASISPSPMPPGSKRNWIGSLPSRRSEGKEIVLVPFARHALETGRSQDPKLFRQDGKPTMAAVSWSRQRGCRRAVTSMANPRGEAAALAGRGFWGVE